MLWWPGTTLGRAVYLVGKVWIAVLPLVWLIAVEREHPGWSPARRGGFGAAILLGLLLGTVVLLMGILAQTQGWIDPAQVAERARQTGLADLRLFLAGALYWITLNSLMEEYVWRWFCFRQCEALFGGTGGVIASALGFTLHHVIALAAQVPWPATMLGSFGVFAGGVAWSWLYLRYRSVWPCYVSHALVDVPIFWLGYRMIFAGG